MKSWLKKTFKIVDWLPSYSPSKLRGDLSAGLTTGIMFIPQGMAYAVIAGVPPIYGLYAGVVPLLIYPLLGTSKNLSVGPVAVDMLIIAAGVSLLAEPNSSRYVSLAILLTMMAGGMQLVMGSMQLGAVFNFFSRPVIAGFTLAAPLIIAFTQLNNLLGIELSNTQYIITVIEEVILKFDQIHLETLLWGSGAIVALVIVKYLKSNIPASVIILAISIVSAWFFNANTMGIQLVGDIPMGLPPFSFPQINFNNMRELLPTALTLALVQFMIVASLGRTFAKRHNYVIDANHELVAIGASNFLGSFFQSIPVSGSFSRSAASEQANVQTPLANIITSGVIIATLLLLTPVFYYLPMPVLAAIIIVSALNLIDISEFTFLFTTKKSEGFIAIFTAVCTLFIGIQEGILLGIVASMVNILYKYSRPNVAELGLIPGTHLFQNIDRQSNAQRIKGIIILRVDASFSFINADFFRDYIVKKTREKNSHTKYVIIDGSTINTLDTTAIDQLKSMATTLRNWDIELYITGLKGPVRDIISKSGMRSFLGEDHFFREPHEAVQYILKIMDRKDNTSRLETYRKEVNSADAEQDI
ncbi:SulP family inorganic anion transporter [Fodinibius sediminis]|uniref:Sulfate permease, SulP family n=1 Tax=Fodinibius sediminis TaxID=1214077 RepID=A0A521AGJ2_9BACT|nr:sulfate permease [Fodinibius sediminis]SMO33922.1 sulfate permease, SulP family [Fodinibius sediminis]